MMKLIHRLLLLLLFPVCLTAQSIPNPGFELWEIDTLSLEPQGWATINYIALLEQIDYTSVTRVTDAHSGNYAVRAETILYGGDTIASGVRCNGQTGNWLSSDGFPYTQKPTHLRGWFKYDIPAGDTAYINLYFKAGGSTLHLEFWPVTGTANTYTELNLPITSFAGTPDHALLYFTSGKPGAALPGGWIIADDLEFLGSGTMDPIPNGGFENWIPLTVEEPVGWETANQFQATGGGDPVTVSLNAHTGIACVRMENQVMNLFGDTLSFLSSGSLWFMNGDMGGFPYTQRPDKFSFWYKYTPVGNDSAIAYVGFTRWNPSTLQADSLEAHFLMLGRADDWTLAEIPLGLSVDPDTAIIIFAAGNLMQNNAQLGSRMYLDDLAFNEPIGVDPGADGPVLKVYPVPAGDRLFVDGSGWSSRIETIRLLDLQGRTVLETPPAGGVTQLETGHLTRGVYLLQVVSPEGILIKKILLD